MSGNLEVRFTAHAEKRITARKLETGQVVAVALAPEQIIEEAGRLPIAQSHIVFMDRPALLRVVFRDEGDVRVIVTAYPTSQIDRYWREETRDED